MALTREPAEDESRRNAIRTAIARKGWTIERAAAETGYSPSYFYMMVREPRLMPQRMARRLAAVLGVPAPDLESLR